MIKEHQAESQHRKQQRPFSSTEPLVAKLAPVQTDWASMAQLTGLPAVPTSLPIRQMAVLKMQQQHGNAAVQRFLDRTQNRNNEHQPASRTEAESGEGQAVASADFLPSPSAEESLSQTNETTPQKPEQVSEKANNTNNDNVLSPNTLQPANNSGFKS